VFKQYQVIYVAGLLFLGVLNMAVAADGFSGYYGPALTKNGAPARDPFSNSDKMYKEVGSQVIQRANEANQMNYTYQPNTTVGAGTGLMPMNAALPKMRLKGLVSKANQKPAALLEIEGTGVYYVTAGEELGLAQGGVLKIISVTETGVKIQAPQMNQPMVVR
jgi:hypothetical protein